MNHQFDERETTLRNRVALRGFYILAGLLFIDYFLKMLSVQWALGPWNGIVYLMLAATVVIIEYIVRGVYFGRKDTPKMRLRFMLVWMIAFGFNVILNILHFTFIEQGQLTMQGSSRIVFSLLTLIGICGTVRAAMDIRRGNRKDEEDYT